VGDDVKTLIAAVVLGGVFGSASASVESNDGEVMVVEIEVEVTGTAETVVAHLTFEDDEMLTLPLLDRGDGLFGLRTELEPKNYAVVFETVGAGGESSEPTTLAQLGADLGPETAQTTTTLADGELSGESRQMLWLAIALGAASLSLIAFWVLGSRDGEPGDEEPPAEGADPGGEEE
jgi:hypothetical protein